jgi:hypothetical protein
LSAEQPAETDQLVWSHQLGAILPTSSSSIKELIAQAKQFMAAYKTLKAPFK